MTRKMIPWAFLRTLMTLAGAVLLAVMLLSKLYVPLNKLLLKSDTSTHVGHRKTLSSDRNNFDINLMAARRSILSSLKRKENQTGGFLIYNCSGESTCGGWSDRLSGILTTMLISLFTNRKFRIQFSSPCELKTYLTPNSVNWSVKSEEISGKAISYQVYMNDLSIFHDLKNIEVYFSYVTFIRLNLDMTEIFRRNPVIRKKIPWICDVHYADMYKIMIDILFKPRQSIVNPVLTSNINTSKKLVCAHVRIGKNMYDKENVWPDSRNLFPINSTDILFDFLKQFDNTEHNIYIATDAPMLKDIARRKFPHNFFDIPGRILHVDRSRRDEEACTGFGKSLAEFWLLSSCDVLVLTRSGFGITAAYMRDNDKPLYCMHSDKIVPCTRYELEEHYPKTIHFPSNLATRRRNDTKSYCSKIT